MLGLGSYAATLGLAAIGGARPGPDSALAAARAGRRRLAWSMPCKPLCGSPGSSWVQIPGLQPFTACSPLVGHAGDAATQVLPEALAAWHHCAAAPAAKRRATIL